MGLQKIIRVRSHITVNRDILTKHFEQRFISGLSDILNAAGKTKSKIKRKKLQSDLLGLIKGVRFSYLGISPGGTNAIAVKDHLCLLFNIEGVHVLLENDLFDEGELFVRNIRWSEEDRLAVFDLFYIVHNKIQTCICHFSRDGFFVYFTQITDCEAPAPRR